MCGTTKRKKGSNVEGGGGGGGREVQNWSTSGMYIIIQVLCAPELNMNRSRLNN